jgi:zinc protease
MRRALLIMALACCTASGPVWAQIPASKTDAQTQTIEKREKVFNAETFMLDNGLQIIVIPNHRAPVVTHMVWYKIGAADELTGKSGIAHFLEHLMFKGSPGFAPGEFSKKIRSLGGEDNAFTGHDYTAYHQSVSADNLEMVMTMEAGRMRGLNPPLDHVDSERLVILEERRQRTDNDPRARFAEQMNALLYINHPYSKPVIGWANEMAGLTWDDCKTFYDKWYAPNNAILIVAGDVTGQQVFDLAKKIYGPIPKGEIPKRVRPLSPPLAGLPEVTLEDAVIREPMVQIVYRTPSSVQNKEETLALQALEEIMSGGPTSRIYKGLVVEQKIATGAGLSYQSASLDDSELWVYATPAPGKDIKAVKAALQDQIRDVIKGGVSETELKEAIIRMQADAIYARDSLTGPAMVFGYSLTTGSTIDDVEYWTYDVAKITAQQVQDVAKKYLDPDVVLAHAPVTGYLLPKVSASPAAEASPKPAKEAAP